MKTIEVFFPSRGRPAGAAETIASIFDQAIRSHGVSVAVGVDEDDPELSGYFGLECERVKLIISPRTSVNITTDNLFDKSTGDIVGFCADDQVIVTHGWDEITRASVKDFGMWHPVRRMGDLERPENLMCVNTFMSKAFEQRLREVQGFVHCPYFPYWWSDTWLDDLSFLIGFHRLMPWAFPMTGKTPLTRGLKDVVFWRDFFVALRPRRIDVAVKLIGDESVRPWIVGLAKERELALVPRVLEANEEDLVESESAPHPHYERLKQEAEQMLREMA